MKIGLLSDTHGYLDQSIYKYFEEVDEIWHAGDIGTEEVLDDLARFKPTRPVWGNIDGQKLRIRTAELQVFTIDGKKVLLTHIAGKPPRYNKEIRKLIAQEQPDLLICGHSHILRVEFDKQNNLLFMNPGAVGKNGFHKVKTMLRFEITKGKVENLEVVELGPRSEGKIEVDPVK
ncbi:MAG: metallophosphoesterase family protein [Cyclobacteriaceae bacterium]